MRSDELDRDTAHMRPELEALRRDAVADPTAVDRFVDGRSFPLIDDGTSTFVYRGEADAVRLRHWVYGLAATPTFTRLDGTDLWYVVLDVPRDSRIEYKIEVIRGDHVESIQDPLNPLTARDPFGANSVLQTDGYERPAWTLPDPEARQRHPGRPPQPQPGARARGRPQPLPPGTVPPDEPLPAADRPRRQRLPRLQLDAGRARQPHPPPRAGRDRRRLQQPAGPAGGVRRPRTTRPLHRRRARAVAGDRVPARRRRQADEA